MKTFTLVIVLVALQGCASIVSKNSYPVTIDSSPSAATFEILDRDGRSVQAGTTPQTITLKSSSGYFKAQRYTIQFSKDGHTGATHTLSSTVDGWYFGNILLGGLIGMLIVDPATGAMYRLPERVDVALDPIAAASNANELTIATLDSLSESQRSVLVPLGR